VIQTPDGHVKILDFGLAKLLDAESLTSTSGGGFQEVSTLTQTQIGIVKVLPRIGVPNNWVKPRRAERSRSASCCMKWQPASPVPRNNGTK
jgi:serine/threonine protein kinase